MNDFKIRLTDLAAARSATLGVDLIQLARDELSKEKLDPENLLFHTLFVEDVDFICYPKDNGIEIDTCYTEARKLDKGPHKGKTVYIPYPESGEDEN